MCEASCEVSYIRYKGDEHTILGSMSHSKIRQHVSTYRLKVKTVVESSCVMAFNLRPFTPRPGLRGHSQTTLTRFCPLLTIYLSTVEICDRIILLLSSNISSTTCLPCLVKVVCESPNTKTLPSCGDDKNCFWAKARGGGAWHLYEGVLINLQKPSIFIQY